MSILAVSFDTILNWLWDDSVWWTIFGLAGNIMFTSRFVVQWYASEKLKQSVIPKNFWHLSLVGGAIQLVYALHLWKAPIILGAILPPVIAARNLALIAKGAKPRPPRTRGQTVPGTIDDGELELTADARAASKRPAVIRPPQE